MKGRSGDNRAMLLADLESTLQRQQDALARLEGLVAKKYATLANSAPREILNTTQDIEEALGRIGRLEAVRASLAARVVDGADGPPGISPLTAASGVDPSAPARLLQARHDILGTIACIAERNEANALLLTGLSRIDGATVDKLSQLREAEAGEWSPPGAGADRRPATLDTRA